MTRLVFDFVFYKMYLSFCNKKVSKILLENPYKRQEELESICAKKGGVDGFVIAIMIVIYFVAYYLILR